MPAQIALGERLPILARELELRRRRVPTPASDGSLLAQAELLDERAIALEVAALQVLEEAPALPTSISSPRRE